MLSLQRRGFGRFDPLVLPLFTAAGLGLGLYAGKILDGFPAGIYLAHLLLTIILGVLVARMKFNNAAKVDPDKVLAAKEEEERFVDKDYWNKLAGWSGGIAWSMGGIFLGLGTVIVNVAAPALVAIVPAAFFISMAVGQFSTKLIKNFVRVLPLGLTGSMVSAIATAAAVFIGDANGASALTITIIIAGSLVGGFSLGLVFVFVTMIYQETVDPDREGMQTAIFFTKIFGGNSLPTLLVGVISSFIGLPYSLALLAAAITIGGIICLVGMKRPQATVRL